MSINSISEIRNSDIIIENKVENKEITDIAVQEIINDEFDKLEEWIDNKLDDAKNTSIDFYNNFHVEIPGNKNNKNESDKDEEEVIQNEEDDY